jgi:medium-chain acyl-[acyl-carrier-protein] hydrolase
MAVDKTPSGRFGPSAELTRRGEKMEEAARDDRTALGQDVPRREGDWLRHYPGKTPGLRLFCFSYAGAGASVFRSWSAHLPPSVEVIAVHPPGREDRLREEPISSVSRLVERLAPHVGRLLDRPFAFFGHSLGALVAFELARRLREARGVTPHHFFASACRAPQTIPKRPAVHQLPEHLFLTYLERMGSLPAALLCERELASLFSRTLRADLIAHETYRCPASEPVLDCPVTIFAGLKDRWVEREEQLPWCEVTRAGSSLFIFPGDHLFLRSSEVQLLQFVGRRLLANG